MLPQRACIRRFAAASGHSQPGRLQRQQHSPRQPPKLSTCKSKNVAMKMIVAAKVKMVVARVMAMIMLMGMQMQMRMPRLTPMQETMVMISIMIMMLAIVKAIVMMVMVQ